jgi:hypothetical protein
VSRRALPVLAAFLLGALLRLWNLGPQVMSDDELHTVRAALGNPVSSILVTYQRTDNTIPLTAIDRVLLDRGVKLTEWTVRLPAVISGLLLLAVAPLWVARRLGWRTAAVFAFLLAVSPGLVFYSRIARSYAPIVLLGFGALACFEAWWRTPEDWRPGAGYAFLAALAAWFHLGAAPFVVSPFLFAAGDGLIQRDRRRFAFLLLLGAATALGFLAFLVPAWGSLTTLLKEKHGELHLTWPLVKDVLLLTAGSGHAWIAVLFWIAAACGFVKLFRSDRRLALFTVTAAFGHVAGLLYLAPQGHEHPLISFRYLLVVLPWALLWVAVAFGGEGRRPLTLALPILLLVILVWAGPFVNPRLWRSPFAHHNDFMTFMWPRPELRPGQVPGFYETLASSPEPGAVLEYPWVPAWRMNRAFYLYQEIHGRQAVVAPARALLADDRLAFRNMVPGTPEGFLASRARWLVVHRNLAREELDIPPPMEIDPRLRKLFRVFGSRMTAQLTQEWGKPDYLDRRIAAWDLDRVRRKR